MTEEQILTSVWLNRAHDTDLAVKALEEVRLKNRSIAERCTASYEGGGTASNGGRENSQERIIHQLCDDDIRISTRLEELLKIRTEIDKVIHELGDSKLEAVLDMRYLAYMKMHEIADVLGCDRKTVNRRHLKGLNAVYEKIKF